MKSGNIEQNNILNLDEVIVINYFSRKHLEELSDQKFTDEEFRAFKEYVEDNDYVMDKSNEMLMEMLEEFNLCG